MVEQWPIKDLKYALSFGEGDGGRSRWFFIDGNYNTELFVTFKSPKYNCMKKLLIVCSLQLSSMQLLLSQGYKKQCCFQSWK
jgi:hypothetical protein